MKFQYLGLLLLSFLLLQSCSRQLVKPLKEIQDTKYSTSWEQLENYPIDRGRSDDLHFFDPNTGFVINSQGYLSFTEDGGESWKIVHENKGTFFRCITFKNRQEGWLGTLGIGDDALPSNDTIALYETKDGGANWSPVEFTGPTPKGLCGLQKVNDQMIVGAGRVRGPSYFIKSTDGGETWYSYDMSHLAGSLIATHFLDEQNGYLIGGTTNDKKNSRSLILKTIDGGISWDSVYLSQQIGEYPWKFSFPTKNLGFISIQRNVRDGRFYYLFTNDGGKTWSEKEHAPSYYYTQGIGFIDEKIGWIGGSNTWTYETRDGGINWNKVKNIGNGFNNFQFFGDSLAYGVGFGVFKNPDVQSKVERLQKKFYADGNLRGTYSIANGKRNGIAKIYHPNGELLAKGNYKDNLKVDKWEYFELSGIPLNTIKMKNGETKTPTRRLKKYVGIYEMKNGGTRTVFFENGQLFTQRGESRKLPIFPENKNRFFYGFNPDITIEFMEDENGLISHTKTFQGGRYSEALKL